GDSPAAAIDAAGDAIVVMHHNAFFQEISESHHLAVGTTWSAPATLTPPPGDAFTNPDVAANATGAIVLAFSDSSGGNNIVSEVSGTAAAGWGTTPVVKALSTASASHPPQVTVAANGAAL